MATMREEVYHKLHPILEDLVDIVRNRIESLEHRDIPEVIKEFCEKSLNMDGMKS